MNTIPSVTSLKADVEATAYLLSKHRALPDLMRSNFGCKFAHGFYLRVSLRLAIETCLCRKLSAGGRIELPTPGYRVQLFYH